MGLDDLVIKTIIMGIGITLIIAFVIGFGLGAWIF